MRNNLMDSETLARFAEMASVVCDMFLSREPLLEGNEKEKHYEGSH